MLIKDKGELIQTIFLIFEGDSHGKKKAYGLNIKKNKSFNIIAGRSGGIHKKPEGRCDKICGPASDEIVIQRRVILSFDGK